MCPRATLARNRAGALDRHGVFNTLPHHLANLPAGPPTPRSSGQARAVPFSESASSPYPIRAHRHSLPNGHHRRLSCPPPSCPRARAGRWHAHAAPPGGHRATFLIRCPAPTELLDPPGCSSTPLGPGPMSSRATRPPTTTAAHMKRHGPSTWACTALARRVAIVPRQSCDHVRPRHTCRCEATGPPTHPPTSSVARRPWPTIPPVHPPFP